MINSLLNGSTKQRPKGQRGQGLPRPLGLYKVHVNISFLNVSAQLKDMQMYRKVHNILSK